MKGKIKYIIILISFFAFSQLANAIATSKSASTISKFGTVFEIIVCSAILYLFLMGVKNCFNNTFKSYKNTAYHNGNKGYSIQSKENLGYNYEIAKRVKALMETKKKSGFVKNSTINEHIKKEEKISI